MLACERTMTPFNLAQPEQMNVGLWKRNSSCATCTEHKPRLSVLAHWVTWKTSSVINTWRNNETDASDYEKNNTTRAQKRNRLSWALELNCEDRFSGFHKKIERLKHAKNPWKWKMTYPYLGNKKSWETIMKNRISSPKPNSREEKWPPYNPMCLNCNKVFSAHWTPNENHVTSTFLSWTNK